LATTADPGQVVYRRASVTRQYNWYQPMGDDALQLGR